jgi:hypothetical protein
MTANQSDMGRLFNTAEKLTQKKGDSHTVKLGALRSV